MLYKDLANEYDVIIAGGGGAGLGLVYSLLSIRPTPPTMLVIEKEAKTQNDRTWCFWGPPSIPFAEIACHSWKKIAVNREGFSQTYDLGDWRYWMVRGIDYYNFIRRALKETPSVTMAQGVVDEIRESAGQACVRLLDKTVTAKWVFDSTLRPEDLVIDTRRYHPIKQHFKGWEIETEQDAFDPEIATLFDLRTGQKNDLRFCYILPFSPHRAMVEYTVFSASLLSRQEYENGLSDYLSSIAHIDHYRIISEENGVIPMTDQPFRRKASEHVLNIGSKGGMVKPSTGYAFTRMQQDAKAITLSLQRNGHPFSLPGAPARYRLFDSILLQILYRHGSLVKPIFVRMFERNPIRRILRFMDETSTPWEDAALIASLPPYPFLRALLKLIVTRRV